MLNDILDVWLKFIEVVILYSKIGKWNLMFEKKKKKESLGKHLSCHGGIKPK